MPERKSSEARLRANKKYHAKTYKTFTVNARIADYNTINDYCNNNDISKAKLLINSAKYCIDNNIDIKNYISNTMEKQEDD